MQLQEIQRSRIFTGPVKAICDPRMPNLCKCPYPGHPKGCPNYDKKPGCPSKVIYFPNHYEDEIYLVAIKFAFGDYLNMMRERHPDWTDRALRNVLYWQGHIRSELKQFLKIVHLPEDYRIIRTPEAMGVNLTETCKQADIKLEWPPMQYTYSIVIGAKRK